MHALPFGMETLSKDDEMSHTGTIRVTHTANLHSFQKEQADLLATLE